MINYSDVTAHLRQCGYDVEESFFQGIPSLSIRLILGNKEIELIHLQETQLLEMPTFFVRKPLSLGRLAHIALYQFRDEELGAFCVNTPDSLSINFDYPKRVFEETLKRYEELLMKVCVDNDFNESEQLREFQAHWSALYNSSSNKKLISTSESGEFEVVAIYDPSSKYGLPSYYLADSKESKVDKYFENILKFKADKVKSTRGYILPLASLPVAPWRKEELPEYYLKCLAQLSKNDSDLFLKEVSYRSHQLWFIFNAPTPSGRTWFALHLQLKNKKSGKRSVPMNRQALKEWDFLAIELISFNKELMMPRSGAELSLFDKKVLLCGVGSVGSEIAAKLASSGLGHLTMIDPDVFSLDNLFRHSLDMNYLNRFKSQALRLSFLTKNPWLNTLSYNDSLLDLTCGDKIQSLEWYDLIIIAIGNPTHERLFSRRLKEQEVDVAVLNTWVEGYAVGGHAILDVPATKGCFYCAYVETSTGLNGLSSNLNFLKDNQNLTKNHGGCGSTFLPYSGVAASQTALIATDLSIKYLLGEVTESSRISWKGSDRRVEEEGLKLNDRYHLFKDSLIIHSLYNDLCDFCESDD